MMTYGQNVPVEVKLTVKSVIEYGRDSQLNSGSQLRYREFRPASSPLTCYQETTVVHCLQLITH